MYIIPLLIVLCYSCGEKNSTDTLQENVRETFPLPAEIDTLRIIKWEEMDINNLSFKELVDSFGKPSKTDFSIINSPVIPDSLAEFLKSEPRAKIITYCWYNLLDSDVWLTVYVLSYNNELRPVFGFAQNSHWTIYE